MGGSDAHPIFFAHLSHLGSSGGDFKASQRNCMNCKILYLKVRHEPLHGGEDAGVGVQELLQLLLGGAAILTPQIEAAGCRVSDCRYA